VLQGVAGCGRVWQGVAGCGSVLRLELLKGHTYGPKDL